MDTEKSSKFLLPLLKEPQSKVTPKWLTQSSEFSMILKKTLKTVLPLKELLKTKDLLLMENSEIELMEKSTNLVLKLLILVDKFSNYNSLAHHTNPAEILLKDKPTMLKPTWLIEDKYVIMKMQSSKWSKLESPPKSPPLVTPFIY